MAHIPPFRTRQRTDSLLERLRRQIRTGFALTWLSRECPQTGLGCASVFQCCIAIFPKVTHAQQSQPSDRVHTCHSPTTTTTTTTTIARYHFQNTGEVLMALRLRVRAGRPSSLWKQRGGWLARCGRVPSGTRVRRHHPRARGAVHSANLKRRHAEGCHWRLQALAQAAPAGLSPGWRSRATAGPLAHNAGAVGRRCLGGLGH